MSKMDWLQYLKSEGFFQEASPAVQVALAKTWKAQQETADLKTMLQTAGMTNTSPCPVGFAIEAATRVGQDCLANQELAFLALLDVVRELKSRIDALESRNNPPQ